MTARYDYVIGDVQGCFATLNKLLKHIKFDENKDHLWFTGDLVARGEDSLAVLKEVRRLHTKGAAHTVLGNHDLNLLAVWRGKKTIRAEDKTAAIFADKEASSLLHWLRAQPLFIRIDKKHVLTHAGIPHIWSMSKAERYAREVESVLAGDMTGVDHFLAGMYGREPDVWDNALDGVERLRLIVNYLTRMRLITAAGQLEFSFKDDLNAPMPKGFAPWFRYTRKRNTAQKILFGHWAALAGKINIPHGCALDGGCVWGGQLIAYRTQDAQLLRVNA